MQLTAKANTICLLKVLEEYSDGDNILKISEIIHKMQHDYGLSVDRRTVYSCVAVLSEMGYDISVPDENGQGYYLASREFDVSEVRLLTSSSVRNRKRCQCTWCLPEIPERRKRQRLGFLLKY